MTIENLLNKIYNENCLDTMARFPNNFIDLTVTSPPYDNLRTYKGYEFDFESIAKELYRVTKDGGVIVWIVNDATIDGSETGTSFKQALYFKEIGFKLHDTMIWEKPGSGNPGSQNIRYDNVFEYMFIFTKSRLKTFNPIKDRKNSGILRKSHGTIRAKDGSVTTKSHINNYYCLEPISIRFNVWHLNTELSNNNRFHPAQFPEPLAEDHILSWSNKGDIIYDPFLGSGTTAKMAILNKREWIGSEISKEYCEIAQKRVGLAYEKLEYHLFKDEL